MSQSRDSREAMEAFDRHGETAVPEAEAGTHNRSHAAHLQQPADAHTKREGDLRQGVEPGALREPPADLRRIGRENRKS